VKTADTVEKVAASTFHTDCAPENRGTLTAKLADFR
jgi:hypothetical protein